MTYTELAKKILELLPEATFDMDGDGQIIIYTNLRQVVDYDDAELINFEEDWDDSTH